LLDGQLVDDFVCGNNIRREGNNFLFLLIGLDGTFQRNFTVYRNDLDVVRVGREILIADYRLADLSGSLPVSTCIGLIVRSLCGVFFWLELSGACALADCADTRVAEKFPLRTRMVIAATTTIRKRDKSIVRFLSRRTKLRGFELAVTGLRSVHVGGLMRSVQGELSRHEHDDR
jgi:hypothetical protein